MLKIKKWLCVCTDYMNEQRPCIQWWYVVSGHIALDMINNGQTRELTGKFDFKFLKNILKIP